jgi:hypothetical protein
MAWGRWIDSGFGCVRDMGDLQRHHVSRPNGARWRSAREHVTADTCTDWASPGIMPINVEPALPAPHLLCGRARSPIRVLLLRGGAIRQPRPERTDRLLRETRLPLPPSLCARSHGHVSRVIHRSAPATYIAPGGAAWNSSDRNSLRGAARSAAICLRPIRSAHISRAPWRSLYELPTAIDALANR